jgi:hypothetical protein
MHYDILNEMECNELMHSTYVDQSKIWMICSLNTYDRVGLKSFESYMHKLINDSL